MVLEPTTSASPGKLLDMKILGPDPGPTESSIQGVHLEICGVGWFVFGEGER